VPSGSGGNGTTVSSAPLGPTAPRGGWSLEYGDAFADQLISSGDNTWQTNRGTPLISDGHPGDTNGFNYNELETLNPSQDSVQSDGLHLTETYSPNRAPAGDGYNVRNYVGGTVVSNTSGPGFQFMFGGGETWAFQVNSKFAPDFDGGDTNGGNDEGWWATDPPWTDEFDFYEHWGWGGSPSTTGDVWVYKTSPFATVENDMQLSTFCACDPSAAFHTYTTIINPNNTFAFFMDGRQVGPTEPAPPYFQKVWMNLILSYGLRNPNNSDPTLIPGFTSGSRDFTVRSVSVYEDQGHTGQDVHNPGLAPGTTLSNQQETTSQNLNNPVEAPAADSSTNTGVAPSSTINSQAATL
jgi:hypothetical protein